MSNRAGEPCMPGSTEQPGSALPLVGSLCGTFLKPEMRSVYRQITGLRRFRTVVLTEQRLHPDIFPFEPLLVMRKQIRPRPKGNFLLRFWYKHVIKQWPPPRPIAREAEPFHPYDLPDLLRREQPALAHVYYGHKAVKYLEMLRAWGGPWVVSFHGVDVVKFLDDPAHLARMREVFEEARLVLARSHSLLERLEALGCPAAKLRWNPTPIPLDAFPVIERMEPPAEESIRIVQASRLIAKKGLFTTLQALREVVRVHPGVKFILCGDGPDRDAFLRAAAEAGLENHVECLGWLDQDALLAEYARARIFLHPSELTRDSDQEGVPNSMLEAMATGLPVVATRHGGIPEAVRHGVDGLLVAEKSPGELADALLQLIASPAMRQAMGRAAAASVREKFGMSSSIGRLEQSYAEVLSNGPECHDSPAIR